jgi:hypothetical protein
MRRIKRVNRRPLVLRSVSNKGTDRRRGLRFVVAGGDYVQTLREANAFAFLWRKKASNLGGHSKSDPAWPALSRKKACHGDVLAVAGLTDEERLTVLMTAFR